MCDVIEKLVGRNFNNGRGTLFIKQFDAREGEAPAFVTYKPLVLNVDIELWQLAKCFGYFEKYVLAHELAHLVLHDHNAKPFSGKEKGFTKFGTQEESAEWQADIWAHHFIVPDKWILRLGTVQDISRVCNVGLKVAGECLASANRRKILRSKMEGEACPECQNFTLVRNGTCLKCETCGATTGCS
jgi:hypothetical protein